MAMRCHFLPEHFTAKKNISTYITHRKGKKIIKIAEEENGLEPERVHARHLDLRLRP